MGKLAVDIPQTRENLLSRANAMAKKKRISLDALILLALEQYLNKEEALISYIELDRRTKSLSDAELIQLCRDYLTKITESSGSAAGNKKDN